MVDGDRRAISRWAVWCPAPVATISGSVASWRWPAHSSCWRTRGVCWSSQEDRQEEGWCQVTTCLDSQTSAMCRTLDPGLKWTSCAGWESHSAKDNYNSRNGIEKSVYFSAVCSSCNRCLWMRPAALKPTVSPLVFPHLSPLSSHWCLKPNSLGSLSADGSLGYQLSSIAQERHCSRAWYISKAWRCLSGWPPFSKHLRLWNMDGHIKVCCCSLAHLWTFL